MNFLKRKVLKDLDEAIDPDESIIGASRYLKKLKGKYTEFNSDGIFQVKLLVNKEDAQRHLKNSLWYQQLNAWLKKRDRSKDRLRDYHEKHTDCLEKNQELLQSHHEITRAYNGLHEMGKFAEELGIDIKQHQDQLPENNKDYKFEQEHKLLESGRVQHIYKIKKDKEKTND